MLLFYLFLNTDSYSVHSFPCCYILFSVINSIKLIAICLVQIMKCPWVSQLVLLNFLSVIGSKWNLIVKINELWEKSIKDRKRNYQVYSLLGSTSLSSLQISKLWCNMTKRTNNIHQSRLQLLSTYLLGCSTKHVETVIVSLRIRQLTNTRSLQ